MLWLLIPRLQVKTQICDSKRAFCSDNFTSLQQLRKKKVWGGREQISAAAKEQTRRLDATDRFCGSKFSTPFETAHTTGCTVVEKLILLL